MSKNKDKFEVINGGKKTKDCGHEEQMCPDCEFRIMYDEVLGNKENNFYSVDIGNFSMRDVCCSLADSLYCLKTGKNYGGYRIRKLD